MKNKANVFDVIIYIIMSFVVVVTLFPLLYIISVSFSSTVNIIANKVTFYPVGFNIDAYKLILADVRIPRAYLNSILYTSVGVTINLLMTSVAAYPLSVKDFFGRKFFLGMIVFTIYFSGGMIPSYFVVQGLGLVNTIWALVLPGAIWTVQLLIMKSFYESLPTSLREAAVIEGASELRILFWIYIPLSKAALASLAMYFFMGHWNDYFASMLYMFDFDKYPLQLVLRSMLIEGTAKDVQVQTGEMLKMTPIAMKNATIVLTMIPVMIIYPFAQKYFTKGIMLGANKG